MGAHCTPRYTHSSICEDCNMGFEFITSWSKGFRKRCDKCTTVKIRKRALELYHKKRREKCQT